MKRIKFLSLIFFIFGISFSVFSQQLYQVSYYEALSKGKLDGLISMSEVIKHGNTGLGGFHALDGEMVLLDGKLYQVLASGKVVTPDLSVKACYAAVYNFEPQKIIQIMGDSNLYNVIDRLVANPNVFAAVMINGTFEYIKTRSVPAQNKPYPLLSEIIKTQSIFERQQIKGTLVGIRTPSFSAGLNPVGYHLHFISDDKSMGGHLLEMHPFNVTCEIMVIDELFIKLPPD